MSDTDIRCPQCNSKLAEVTAENHIRARGFKSKFRAMTTTNDEAILTCGNDRCYWTGLFIVNYGWETTASAMHRFVPIQ